MHQGSMIKPMLIAFRYYGDVLFMSKSGVNVANYFDKREKV